MTEIDKKRFQELLEKAVSGSIRHEKNTQSGNFTKERVDQSSDAGGISKKEDNPPHL